MSALAGAIMDTARAQRGLGRLIYLELDGNDPDHADEVADLLRQAALDLSLALAAVSNGIARGPLKDTELGQDAHDLAETAMKFRARNLDR